MAKFCGKCGAKADNGAKFCPECGEPLKQTEPPFVPPVVPRKTWNTIAVCIAMVILVVGRIVILPEKSEFIKTSSSIWSYSKKATDWNNNLYTVFSVDGIRINPVDYIEYKKGPDYDALAYILNHNPDILGGTFVRTQSINGEAGCILADDGTLYYIRAYGTVTVPGEILPLAENVLSCAISADGTGVAYVDDSEVLMLCSCDDDKKSALPTMWSWVQS